MEIHAHDPWFGVTYREDRPFVVEGSRKLIARGDSGKIVTGAGVFSRLFRPMSQLNMP